MDQTSINQIKQWQGTGKVVVLATGVFDILHLEHFRFLKKAKAVGDKLIVGLESDQRVKAIKGQARPLNDENARVEQLQAIKYVDLVFILPETFSTQVDWEHFMSTLKPDVYAASSHSSYLDNKRLICQKFGITFKIVHDFNPNFSSSTLINKLQTET